MTQEGQLPPPPVIWAQRSPVLYVTICLEDCKDPTIKVEEKKIYFKGVGGTDHKMHEITINLFKEIVPDKTVQTIKGRTIELILSKAADGPYWPRLTEENTKFHWLKSDFNKWKDEDEGSSSDDDKPFNLNSGHDFEKMMHKMGGRNSLGDSKPNFDDLDDNADAGGPDSDDDDIPDLYFG